MMLTIVLPTAGRAEFSRRFERHVGGLPFKFINVNVGEGPVSADQWFTAIRDVASWVETPYAMLADNDDLPTLDLARCVAFLEHHPDYVACSGRIQGFHMWPDPVTGPESSVTKQYAPFDTPADYGQDDMTERVLAGFANSWAYYAVYRTAALQDIWRGIVELGITNLQVHDKFVAMRGLTLGKTRCFPSFTSLYRQYGTSVGGSGNMDWIRHTIDGSLQRDMHKVLTVMEAHGVDREQLYVAWSEWYRKLAINYYGPKAQTRKLAKRLFPKLAWVYQHRHRYLPGKRLEIAL